MIIVLKGGHNMSSVSSDTQFNLDTEAVRNALRRQEMRKDLEFVYSALCEKGYNPTAQIIGYILTEDPTNITAHNQARQVMSRLDRFEILEELLRYYYALDNKV